MNNVQLTGRLTQNPELRNTSSDTSVCQMRVAVSRPRRNGEDQRADFVDVSVFGTQADNCVKYLAKGSRIAAEGHLHHSEWTTDTGRRQKLEVVARRIEFLSPPTTTNGNGNDGDTAEPAAVATGDQSDPEDIPF